MTGSSRRCPPSTTWPRRTAWRPSRARLRAPDGCPWDRRQTHASLRPFVLEEAYETVDAIERGAPADLAEELGDLLLQIILHAQLAAEEGAFDLTDVYRSIGAKIVRRHPHVFGDVQVAGVEQVLANWETIKAAERSETRSARQGRSTASPARCRRCPASREIQERASALGWDWPSIEGVWEKVARGARRAATRRMADRRARLHELGDVLFALVNLGRWLKLDPEEALRTANRRWIDRYAAVSALAASARPGPQCAGRRREGRALGRGETPVSGRPVAIVVHATYPQDQRVRRQATALIQAGHEVDVFALRDVGQEPREEFEGVQVHRLPVNRTWYGVLGHLAEYVAFLGVATVGLTRAHRRRALRPGAGGTVPDFLALAAVPVKLAGVPLLLDLHEDMPAFYRDRFPGKVQRPLMALVSGVTRGIGRDCRRATHRPRAAAPAVTAAWRRPRAHHGGDEQPRRAHLRPVAPPAPRIHGGRRAAADPSQQPAARLRPGVRHRGGCAPRRPAGACSTSTATGRIGRRSRRRSGEPLPPTACGCMAAWRSRSCPACWPVRISGWCPRARSRTPNIRCRPSCSNTPSWASRSSPATYATFRAHLDERAIRYVAGADATALAAAVRADVADPAGTLERAREAQRQSAPYAWPGQRARYLEVVERLLRA